MEEKHKDRCSEKKTEKEEEGEKPWEIKKKIKQIKSTCKTQRNYEIKGKVKNNETK